ncbi:RidA family protein [Labrys okinawensis]|uniref:RidA family protein n=1 Tax=Labrys okinawensis TaxID=346911 RepID=UPI0039BD759D
MLRAITPPSLRAPFARYSHAIEVLAGTRLVFCSGQLGIGTDEVIPEGAEAQAALIFQSIAAILAEADMGLGDIVRINAYVTAREHMAGYMKARDTVVSNPPPASTLMIVSGFTREEFKVEVEVVAAKP